VRGGRPGRGLARISLPALARVAVGLARVRRAALRAVVKERRPGSVPAAAWQMRARMAW
jgi:hypothetical protein